MVIWMSAVVKKSQMVPKKMEQSIDTLPLVFFHTIFSVIEEIFPCHSGYEAAIGKLSELTTLVVEVVVARTVAQFSIKNGLMRMDVHPETVLIPGTVFAGHGYTFK